MPLTVGVLVWEKWLSDWYMGHVTATEAEEEEEEEDASPKPSSSSRRVKIHIHGEPDTRDKWYESDSANLVELVQVEAKETTVGVFPQAGDAVELLVVDASLTQELQHQGPLLRGVVHRVYPARDASMVDVEYPPGYALVPTGRRRVCVSNGYIRVIVKDTSPSSPA